MVNNTLKKLCEYGAGDLYLSELPRVICLFDRTSLFKSIRQHHAARCIQREWDACLSNPHHCIGKNRLAREFQITQAGGDVTDSYAYHKKACTQFDTKGATQVDITPFYKMITVPHKQIINYSENDTVVYCFRNNKFRPVHPQCELQRHYIMECSSRPMA